MAEESLSLDDAGRAVASLWRVGPDYTLLRYAQLAPEGAVLDAGIGDGRNALLLAALGREVEGTDVSEAAVRRCLERARQEGLTLAATVGDLRDLPVAEGRYALVVAAWVLHFIRPDDYQAIAEKLVRGLKEGGLIYLGVFTPDDPSYARAKERFVPLGENTFYLKKIDEYRHYFTRAEVLSLFADLERVYLAEGTQLDFGHGEPHLHGFVEYVGRKRT
jgi:tellurite methyltransferase